MSRVAKSAEAQARLINAPTLDGDSSDGSPAVRSRIELQRARIGRFVLLRELGSGGMGSVFAAYDEQIDRKVALKILHRTQAGDATLRTLREAKAAARISHPNIIAIYEVGELDGNIHIAMEYVEGGTLLDWQTRGNRSWRDILRVYLQVGEALLAAHEADVVHRDFKPDNVLIDQDERPRVADFGLARLGWADEAEALDDGGDSATLDDAAQREDRITRPGVIFGTPGYMSPEQHRGGDVDSRSDQWSFCAALYEALYGYLPFSGSSLREHARSVHEPPRPPPADTQVPDELRQALSRGLLPSPSQRFASMADLLAILSQELRGGVAAGSLSRQRFNRAFIVAVLVVIAVGQARWARSDGIPRATGLTWAALIVVVLLGGLWRRRTLLSNRFHRHMWLLILLCMVLCLLQRFVGFALGLNVPQLFPFQMLTLAGITTIMAATLIRQLFFVPALPLVACVLSLTMKIPQQVLNLVYLASAISVALGWSHAANAPQIAIGETDSDAATAPRQRRTKARPRPLS